ncbi:DUF3667 domain-containing protein [Anthocerotibacter panamensis]|uniref:DUF3667 domain-containing protein n=1 Tax=Anthocerotibacter panamensis TaxID=2857077 RepID=UPI001C408338|nr:DUF3667 domain-containing protein [Anthocerotibacter panamensis]
MEFVEEYFTLDTKLLRSLIPLLFRPGYLTKAYNQGQRVRYISPLRTYLVVSVIYFFILAWSTSNLLDIDLKQMDQQAQPGAGQVKAKPAAVQSEQGNKININVIFDKFTIDVFKLPSSLEVYENQQRNAKIKDKDGPTKNFIVKKIILIKQMGFEGFLKKLASDFTGNLPQAMFLLLPLFALLLKLLYRRAKHLYVEHLTFSLHFHSFVFILLSLSTLINNQMVSLLVTVAIGFYLLFALKTVYEESFLKTSIKLFVISIGYLMILSFALITSLFATVALTVYTL